MVNGIPPIVSNRGALPDVIKGDATSGGGGLVRPVPDWMTPAGTRIPSEQEIEPWFGARMRVVGRRGPLRGGECSRPGDRRPCATAKKCRARGMCDYFTSLEPGGTLFPTHTSPPADRHG